MQFRFESSRNEVSTFTTQQIRDNFLIENIFSEDQIELTYSIYDRMIIGGAMPKNKTLTLLQGFQIYYCDTETSSA